MCWINVSSDASVAAIVGALTATIGTWMLWRTQIRYENVKELERHKAAAHNAMMTMEAQRTFVEALQRTIKNYAARQKTIEDVPAIYANHNSVPRIQLNELSFLTERAKNKSVLPRLVSLQQSFDQMIDTLNRVAEERRALHFAKNNKTAFDDLVICVSESDNNLLALIQRLMTDYPAAQSQLEDGINDSIPGFKAIYRR